MAQEWFEKPVFVRKNYRTYGSAFKAISPFRKKVAAFRIAMGHQPPRRRSADPMEDISNLIAGASLLLKILFNVIFWKATHSDHPSDATLNCQ
ncbi:hypothetical protein DTW90_36505 [Neorhizobium sp. P12A]|jgi:hypothetical protein|uniref:hypothetical protein n=1 Tax=Rhizobium/Agrobacterium group TaxID=227290 RepID=UPI00104EF86A|nr:MULTISPECIES: hypothetical protein [Rhizobium/Agrobacterium group]KAA0683261.1 hypothetical protein DTW90_36505 [Neorhizobium sp. P12A]TCR66905.1 hypothetical protein EV561_1526 [Rhizobium sp. BK376]